MKEGTEEREGGSKEAALTWQVRKKVGNDGQRATGNTFSHISEKGHNYTNASPGRG